MTEALLPLVLWMRQSRFLMSIGMLPSPNVKFLKVNFILSHYRMLAKSQIESMASGNKTVDPGSHPVIRTLYDHMGE